jgi:omega-6 fatty acid desaturase (delta-12 desaturase)
LNLRPDPIVKPVESLYPRTKAYARDNSWKSWWCILTTAFFLVTALTGTLPGLPLALRITCSGLAGLLMVRLFVIYHDHQHRAILPKSRLAEILMRVVGICLLCPSSTWRHSHDHHHAHNSKLRESNLGSYPVMTRERYQKSSPLARFKYLFLRHPITLLCGYLTVFLFNMTLRPIFESPRKHYDCLLAFVLHLALGATLVLLSGWGTLALTLLVPFTIASALGAYLFYAQHNFPSVTLMDEEGWTYEGAALESSSHLKTNPIIAWFTANIGYHHIHHLNHRIPFYRLPEIYRDIPELRRAKTTTLHPRDILRCLRLKVWCVETQRVVGVRGL